MGASLTLKNVPADLLERLRSRAKRNHRSLQGEIIALIEAGLQPARLGPAEVLRQVREIGLRTPDEATAIIRADRDAR